MKKILDTTIALLIIIASFALFVYTVEHSATSNEIEIALLK